MNKLFWLSSFIFVSLIHGLMLSRFLPEHYRLKAAGVHHGNHISLGIGAVYENTTPVKADLKEKPTSPVKNTAKQNIKNAQGKTQIKSAMPTPVKTELSKIDAVKVDSPKADTAKVVKKAAPKAKKVVAKIPLKKHKNHTSVKTKNTPVNPGLVKQSHALKDSQAMVGAWRKPTNIGTSLAHGSANSQKQKKHRQDYQALVHAWLTKHKRYPKRAMRKRIEGQGVLYFKLDSHGNVLAYTIRKGTGSRLLDRELKSMLHRAAPLPGIPDNLSMSTMEFTIPVSFSINRQRY